MIKNNFIKSLKYMNEETIINHIKYGKHNLIETNILKKRLNDINNKKIQDNKISYLENIIKNQQIEINNLKKQIVNNKLDRIKILMNKIK